MTGKKTLMLIILFSSLSVANSQFDSVISMISIPLLLKVERFYLITCVITWSWWIKLCLTSFFCSFLDFHLMGAGRNDVPVRVNPYFFSCHFQKEIACASLVPGSKRCVDEAVQERNLHLIVQQETKLSFFRSTISSDLERTGFRLIRSFQVTINCKVLSTRLNDQVITLVTPNVIPALVWTVRTPVQLTVQLVHVLPPWTCQLTYAIPAIKCHPPNSFAPKFSFLFSWNIKILSLLSKAYLFIDP